MSGSSVPPGGFHWVEPSQPPPPGPGVDRRSVLRRWWVWLAAAAVIALVAGGVTAVLRRPHHHGDSSPSAAPAPVPPIGTPKDRLISFPLDREPIPGWQITGADIGLPDGIKIGDMFASDGDKAYFITNDGCNATDRCNGWLYGIDTTTGSRLFPPLQLPTFYGQCRSNGPSVAVCNTVATMPNLPPSTVWVIDLDRGEVTFTGPSTFDRFEAPSDPRLEEVGDHLGQTWLVASIRNKGIYGVGDHAELSWFIPGTGQLMTPNYLTVDDIPPLTLAVEPNPIDANPRYRVFSVIDGTDLTPTPPPGILLEEATVYNGGFAYQFSEGTKLAGTIFYDPAGREVGRQQPQRSFPQDNSAMPIISVGDTFEVYDAGGKLQMKIPAAGSAGHFRTIGTKLYTKSSGGEDDQTWQQWDLLTGRPGPTCEMKLDQAYVASDGVIIITEDSPAPSAPRHYSAIDTATCEKRWETAENVRVQKVGRGLIQSTDDTTTALRPPT